MSMMTSRGLSGEPLSARGEEVTIQYTLSGNAEKKSTQNKDNE